MQLIRVLQIKSWKKNGEPEAKKDKVFAPLGVLNNLRLETALIEWTDWFSNFYSSVHCISKDQTQ